MRTDYFLTRHTIRKFSDKPVSDSLIESIVERAAKAPTTGNMQLYSVILTRDKEKKEMLDAMHFNQPAAKNAPLIVTVCADLERFTRWCELNGAEAGFENFLSFIYAFSDAMIFTQQFVTIAEMEGLGTCYLGTVLSNIDEISNLLELPQKVIPVAALSVGYPDESGEDTERLSPSALIHLEKYHNAADGEIIEVFKVKDDYPANKKFVEENGKENLARVFAEVRYPRNINEITSEKIVKFLKERNLL